MAPLFWSAHLAAPAPCFPAVLLPKTKILTEATSFRMAVSPTCHVPRDIGLDVALLPVSLKVQGLSCSLHNTGSDYTPSRTSWRTSVLSNSRTVGPPIQLDAFQTTELPSYVADPPSRRPRRGFCTHSRPTRGGRYCGSGPL